MIALFGGPFLNDLVFASVGAGKCRMYWNQDLRILCFAAFFLNSGNFSVHPILMDFPEIRDTSILCIFLRVALQFGGVSSSFIDKEDKSDLVGLELA